MGGQFTPAPDNPGRKLNQGSPVASQIKMEPLEVHIYPCTIINDRYTGSYSGGKWIAFPMHEWEIPPGPSDADTECSEFWDSYEGLVGKGPDPLSAYNDLRNYILHKLTLKTKGL
jgi:hypothetical protein